MAGTLWSLKTVVRKRREVLKIRYKNCQVTSLSIIFKANNYFIFSEVFMILFIFFF